MSQNINCNRTLTFTKGGGGTPKIIMDAETTADVLYVLPATDATESVCFGNGTDNLDVTFYGASGTSSYMRWDESGDDLVLAGADFLLGSGAVINFNSGNVTITHSTGALTLNSTSKLQFAGANQYIQCSAADTLAINSGTTMNLSISGTTEVTLNATNFTVSGTNFLVGTDGAGKVSRFYANTANYNVAFSPSGDSNKGVWYFGSGTWGVDVHCQSHGAGYMLWDASEAKLTFVQAGIDFTTSASGTYEILLKNNVADALSIKSGANDFIVFTTTTAGPELSFHQRLNLIGAGIIMDTAVSGSYNIDLKNSVADALSIRRGTTDMMCFNTSIPIIDFYPLVRFYGTSNRGAIFPPLSRLEWGDANSYMQAPSTDHIQIRANATDGDAIALYSGTGGSVQMANCFLNLFNSPGTDGDSNGDIWYDTVSNTFKGFENGSAVTFTTS